MYKNNVKIKDEITLVDQINVIERIVTSCFTDGEYTPYFSNIGLIEGIAMYILDGLEFDENEFIYELVMNDIEIKGYIDEFIKEDGQYNKIFNFIMEYAKDKIEFHKEKIIHTNDAITTLFEKVTSFFNSISNLKITEDDLQMCRQIYTQLTPENITVDAVAEAIKKTSIEELVNRHE